jgi:hypothetical protein
LVFFLTVSTDNIFVIKFPGMVSLYVCIQIVTEGISVFSEFPLYLTYAQHMTPESEEVGEWISNRCLTEVVTFCLYSSPSIIRIIRSRRMRWAGHVPRIGGGGGERRRMCAGYWWGSQRERDH